LIIRLLLVPCPGIDLQLTGCGTAYAGPAIRATKRLRFTDREDPVPRGTIEREVVLPAPPDAVWDALTDGEQLSAWFGAEVHIEARPNGFAEFRWPDGEVRTAVVESLEPRRELILRWTPLRRFGGRTTVDRRSERVAFALQPAPGGTRLRVVESGVRELAG